MLEANRNRVRNLSGIEIWLFIVGRVLAGFGLGILAMVYFPRIFVNLGAPIVIIGIITFLFASKGLVRKQP